MRQAVQDIVKVPVILASSLLGRLAAEMAASSWTAVGARLPGSSGAGQMHLPPAFPIVTETLVPARIALEPSGPGLAG
jgi:hypothetical protein